MARKLINAACKVLPFQEGDRVFAFKYGEGVVLHTHNDSDYYPIEVQFSTDRESYDKDGRQYSSDLLRSLFHLAEMPRLSVRNVVRRNNKVVQKLSSKERSDKATRSVKSV